MPEHKHGRGAGFNPPNRFERLHIEPLDDDGPQEERLLRTEYFLDSTHSILASNDSPDVPFRYSINPYRGCEHGCIYCYARATHEYLGFSAGLDFESRIIVKPDAPELLEKTFVKKTWKPEVIAFSGNTDCYQPVERRLQLTRKCLDVFLRFRNPVSMITKSHLVTRDVDVLAELASFNLVQVSFSITTLNPDLARSMEPRAASPEKRLEALELLSRNGIPTVVTVAPVIPGLTDEELPAILRECAARGARRAAYILVRFPHAVRDLFQEWLERTLPQRSAKVLNRIREVRGGKLSESEFGTRVWGEGRMAEAIRDMFEIFARKYGLNEKDIELSTSHFVRAGARQLSMFRPEAEKSTES
jgi:DNA repair photolyase